jgi:hypothetical protein
VGIVGGTDTDTEVITSKTFILYVAQETIFCITLAYVAVRFHC